MKAATEMAPVYKNKYVSDIPLKRPQETFVDDPDSLDEVSLKDLVFDLANDVKDINNLHGFHAVAVLQTVLEDLIFLGANKDARQQYRRQQLENYALDLDVLSGEAHDLSVASSEVNTTQGSPSPSAAVFSPPSESSELFNFDSSLDLGASALNFGDFSRPVNGTSTPPLMSQEDCSAQSLVTSEPGSARLISTESLVQTTSLDVPEDPITCLNIERMKKEVLFHMSPKVRSQADHLLRCFSLAKAPPISIAQFLLRIKTYSPSISVSVYIHSAYMLYKLCVLLDVVEMTPLNVYRFILASLRCSTKKLEDVHQRQKSFATVGGVALKELCKIEVSFLYLFNFKMVVSEYILNQFLTTEFVALHAFCDELRSESSGGGEKSGVESTA